jgi:hypothetical protein
VGTITAAEVKKMDTKYSTDDAKFREDAKISIHEWEVWGEGSMYALIQDKARQEIDELSNENGRVMCYVGWW